MGNGASRLDIGISQLDPATLTGVGAKCLHALRSNITCANITGSVFSDDFNHLAYQDLEVLCAGECAANLSLYQDALYWACSPRATWNDTRDSSIWPVTSSVDRIAHHLDLACLRRSDGQLCDDWFAQGAYEVETPECDECYLETVRLQAVSPMAEAMDEMVSIYQSLSSSCTYTGVPVTRTVSSPMLSSPTGTPICDYTYTIQPGDSAISVSQTQKVSTHGLLDASGFRTDVLEISGDGELCIKNRCHTDSIQPGDTCDSLAAPHNITVGQLQAWNPWAQRLCDVLENSIGALICTSDFDLNPFEAPTPSNRANQTTAHCAKFHVVTEEDSCLLIEYMYHIKLDDFLFLNQEVSSDCTNLRLGRSYCVVPVGDIISYPGYGSPKQPQDWTSTWPSPSSWEIAADYDQMGHALREGLLDVRDPAVICWRYERWEWPHPPPCKAFAAHWHITYDELVTWNPSLTEYSKADCEVQSWTTYCVRAPLPAPNLDMAKILPVPRARDEVRMCVSWIHGGYDCEAVIAASGLNATTFLEYNPTVGEDCHGMDPDMWYCNQTYADLDTIINGSPAEQSVDSPSSASIWPGHEQQGVLQERSAVLGKAANQG